EEPPLAVGPHDERVRPGVRVEADPAGLAGRAGRLPGREVRYVAARPLLAVPPDVPLPLAPRRPVGPRRGAVVHDAAVRGPRVGPAEVRVRSARRIGGVAGRAVLAGRREDPAVDPGG